MRGNPFDFIPYILGHQEQFLRLFSQHVQLTVLSVVIGILIAIPLAIMASRVDALAGPVTWLAGAGQTIPSLAILGLTLPLLGIGFVPSLFALTVRAVLPILLNTYVGIRGVDRAIVDAAYFEDRRSKDVGAEFGETHDNVDQIKKRFRNALRAALVAQGVWES